MSITVVVNGDGQTVNINISDIEERLKSIEVSLARVQDGINAVLSQGEKLMSQGEDVKAALKKLDDETTLVANNITALAAKVHNSMTDQEAADVKAGFDALAARLTTLAVDPTNPVPPVPGPLGAMRKKLK